MVPPTIKMGLLTSINIILILPTDIPISRVTLDESILSIQKNTDNLKHSPSLGTVLGGFYPFSNLVVLITAWVLILFLFYK